MKVVILAGGLGTRLSEETSVIPKPMVELDGKPILWHIMKTYSQYGFNEFVILLGYKGYLIKEYFFNYFLHQSDITIDLVSNNFEVHKNSTDPWKVTLLDTGINTMTGGRIKRAESFIGDNPFLLTYGDGVSDINISELIEFHKTHGKAVTLSAIQPEGRFGMLDINEAGSIKKFKEKPVGDGGWINGGYFVCEPEVFKYITNGDDSVFEQAPLQNLAKDGQLFSYKHKGFWKCMDTQKDKKDLIQMIKDNKAKWIVWS